MDNNVKGNRQMKWWLASGVISCVAIIGGGCSQITMLRTEELKLVQQHVDSLHMNLREEQNAIQKNQKDINELLRLIRADQQVKFGDIERRIGAIESQLSESQYRLSKIDEKAKALQSSWEEKLRSDSLAKTKKEDEIQNLFQIAFGDFTAGRYDLAIRGFEDLVNQFPDSPLAQEASYWIAESYYVKTELDEAEARYKKYIKEYPSGKKICASLYKLGLVYDKQNKSKSRSLVWKKLIQQCPDSEEARAARAQE
jgi:tol-pal system protein YbgF